MNEAREKVLEAIKESLPKFFRIKDQSILGQKTIYNLLSQGRGPEVVDMAGGKFLERDSFVSWLDSRSRNTLKRGRKRSAA
jgi:hypothetical protein